MTDTTAREILSNAADKAARDTRVSDYGRLVSHQAQMLDVRRQQLIRGDHDHAIARARLIAEGQRELEELRQRMRDRIDEADAHWERTRDTLVEEIDRLTQMKEIADGRS